PVVGEPAVRHVAEPDELGGAAADDLGRPPLRPADVRGQLPQRPFRAGRDRAGLVLVGGDAGQPRGELADAVVAAVFADHGHRPAAPCRSPAWRSVPVTGLALRAGQRPQPHWPPQQPPAPPPAGPAPRAAPPPTPTADSSFT